MKNIKIIFFHASLLFCAPLFSLFGRLMEPAVSTLVNTAIPPSTPSSVAPVAAIQPQTLSQSNQPNQTAVGPIVGTPISQNGLIPVTAINKDNSGNISAAISNPAKGPSTNIGVPVANSDVLADNKATLNSAQINGANFQPSLVPGASDQIVNKAAFLSGQNNVQAGMPVGVSATAAENKNMPLSQITDNLSKESQENNIDGNAAATAINSNITTEIPINASVDSVTPINTSINDASSEMPTEKNSNAEYPEAESPKTPTTTDTKEEKLNSNLISEK
ncbi:hypothetical protein EDEG_03096 [Edhazardia aedis USNM 41457]|uniref:Uncharacterized protein n=1 Tax=Edhazardia aedis (strain USNM 41457) TaxID=1003232 RepID=J9D3S4_EDHAE|nr:hypothetical protein EDEG_03096 [Edhazardia aedis USNM 41457]|eukprot:EJW02476.1 hypothetical protein EDEG_03096 [Edhazardia aedis USNM 41457]